MMRTVVMLLWMLPLHVAAAEAWLPVRDVSLMIEPGSILDFSAIAAQQAPIQHRLIINAQGHFAHEDAPDKPQRFLMGSLGFGTSNGGFPSHAVADLYVRQFRLHGYNMARLDFIEATLMHGRKGDFDFDPEQLDRLHYLLAALRKAGIYYVLNGLSSGNGGYGNIEERWINQKQLTLGVYYDPEKQVHWKTLMEKLFAAQNRYTGATLAKDPALAGVIMVNEGGLAFVTRNGVPDALKPMFSSWLKKKYTTTTHLAAAWKQELRPGEAIETQSVGFPGPTEWTSTRMADTQRFFVEMEQSTAAWMTDHLRKIGYKGSVTAYNNWLSPAMHASRGQFAWVDLHNYFAEPTNDASPGSIMRQDSMLAGSATYIRELAAGRHWGHAYTVTEFGQVFWNRYRRESGLAVAAYAALQGWDAICQHAGAVSLSYVGTAGKKELIGPFDVGLDPIARASETLAALLFLRGDVAQAKSRVDIKLTPRFVFEDSAQQGNVPGDLSRVALVTGLGLDWLGRAGNMKQRLQLEPTGGGKVEERWAEHVDVLRKQGVLPVGNLTDAGTGLYQSDTGQIVLNSHKKLMTVMTPRTEAVVYDQFEPQDLGHLVVEQSDGPALISVSAMDDRVLGQSRRILLVLATDARNTGMRFVDRAETILQTLGIKPVTIRSAIVQVKFRSALKERFKVYSATLRGKRGDVIPVTQDSDGIRFKLDTAVLSHGPTTFFEIAVED